VSTYEVLLWLSLALQTAAIIIEIIANRLLQWRACPSGVSASDGVRVLVQIGSTEMRVPDASYNFQAPSTAFQVAGAVRR
jgi:hypothetical protein